MDEGLSRAVVRVFVDLHSQGLIYKDKRLVNWDPKLGTAISDLEVEQVETKGQLWHFRYPLADGATYRHPFVEDGEGARRDWRPSEGAPSGHATRDFITVATTRPETMLGDTGVAVHPDDPRYRDLIGREVILPLVGRRIPIVGDEYPDPEAGTGAVKMTPAHDFNDFELGRRRGLRAISVLTPEARVTLSGNDDFLAGLEPDEATRALWSRLEGMDRFEARKAVVDAMEASGHLERVEPHTHTVPHGDRGGVPIEPLLTDQWYVDARTLAQPALAAVREGRTRFVPQQWEATYFRWMDEIQPWCISRQLWWGHQIPAWYGPDGALFVAEDEEAALSAAIQHYLATEGPWKAWVEQRLEDLDAGALLRRDPDVLDTWFSSALWPFSTLGWPDTTPELARYYPTSVLVTGFDIIFFWVARMMMMGLKFMDEVPFHDVYVHALVRDKHGAKMSKSKGNVVDPLELIDQYGADALRFTLAILAAQGRDVKLDPDRVAGYRNFGTKLWNAARFAQINGVASDTAFRPTTTRLTLNRWILTELSETVGQTTEALERYRFNDAAGAVYRFVWNTFCDWYLELAKPILAGDDVAAKAEVRACAAHVLNAATRLLHPFMPFMTEELWSHLAVSASDPVHDPDAPSGLVCHAPWPQHDLRDGAAQTEINWLISLVTEIRSVRAESGVKPAAILPLSIVGDEATSKRVVRHRAAIERLVRVSGLDVVREAPPGRVQAVLGDAILALDLGGAVDFAAERQRFDKELKRLDGEVRRLEAKLSNERFTANAPANLVEEEREKLAGYEAEHNRFRMARERIAAL